VTDDVTIRRIRATDAGRARALRLEMLADAPLAYITTLADAAAMAHAENLERVRRAAEGDAVGQFVALDGRTMVGQVVGITHPERTDTTLLVAVYVTPAWRGGGVLGGMVEATAAWSRAAGRPRLELEVVTTNVRAARAYRKLGFTPQGAPVPHPTIPLMTEQVMTRPA
jgi:RimJ/RimL family protein N-acetyltransferase